MILLITGVAGFIGSHLAQSLLEDGNKVIGIDNLNDYYSTDLKLSRLSNLTIHPNFTFQELDIVDGDQLKALIQKYSPHTIFHLAAQAGVRLPISSFSKYLNSNLTGFANVVIAAAELKVPNFLYASSSSVYGNSAAVPYKENGDLLDQVSFYGATKFTNEILAQNLSRSHGLKSRGMRFFTVYGPLGRPDMAYFKIINSVINDEEFVLFGDGTIRRDFTFVSDVVASIKLLSNELEHRDFGHSDVVNIGGGKPNSMSELIECVSRIAGKEVQVIRHEGSSADVKETLADCELQMSLTGFVPKISLDEGILSVYEWAAKPENATKIRKWLS